MKAYHTCSNRGGIDAVSKKAPFLSKNSSKTWLTQGYYFWTEDPYFAYKWGKDAYDDNYFIFEYFLNFTEEKKYLDLTSLQGQLYFNKIISKVKIKGEFNWTVNALISFLRDKKNNMGHLFPYIAIKAKDSMSQTKIIFVKGRNEYMPLFERHQVCVFQEAADIIQYQRIEYPAEKKGA